MSRRNWKKLEKNYSMNRKYWKSQKDPRFLKNRRKDLEKMLDFLNADIRSGEKDQLVNLVATYASFMGEWQRESPFFQFMRDLGYYLGDLVPDSPPEVLQERKEFFAELQLHLRARVEETVRAMKSGETLHLFNIQRRVMVEPSRDRFVEEPLVEEIRYQDALEDEKRKIDIAFANIVRDLDLRPSRLRICLRCRGVFYQPTNRGKHYCSLRCADAVRQGRYKKRKREAKVST
jgi:hypothetical protein